MDFLGFSIDVFDVIDIAIVAILLYVGLVWFKRTKSFLVVVGIVILGVVYAAARLLNLYLTTAILQGFFAVLLIAVIVIFQEELRQFFERVAVWGLGRTPRPQAAPLIEALVRTSSDLARARTGALIVIAGRDPLERHVEGGTILDGRPSEPLFKSIFDTSSPGHDGALVIKEGRVARFAAYLPLSRDLTKLTGRGTRHAAALGLSERCDAMCIVVSEERGEVSIARDGNLTVVKDLKELGPIIIRYLHEKYPPPQRRRLTRFLSRNLREKAIAVLLAVGLWAVFAQSAGVVHRDFVVPIEFANMPADFSIDRMAPRRLTVTIVGDERAFKLFNADELKATFDLTNAREGLLHVPVNAASVSRLPMSLKVDGVHPSDIELTLKRNNGAAGGK